MTDSQDNNDGAESIPAMQRLLDNPFLLLFLGVAIPGLLYVVWGVMEVAMIPNTPMDGGSPQVTVSGSASVDKTTLKDHETTAGGQYTPELNVIEGEAPGAHPGPTRPHRDRPGRLRGHGRGGSAHHLGRLLLHEVPHARRFAL